MSWRNIKLIFLREVRDQARDRRTLFMVAMLPMLLYPALGIGMVQMTLLFAEQRRTVVILGEDHLPPPQLLEDDHFAPAWFTLPSDAEKLRVVTERTLVETDEDASDRKATAEVLDQARQIREKVMERAEILRELDEAEEQKEEERVDQLVAQLEQITGELGDLFAVSRMQVLIIVPDGFDEYVQHANRSLAVGHLESEEAGERLRPIIVRNSADEKSLIAFRRTQEAMMSWEQEILKQRLRDAHLPVDLPTPINPDRVDLAKEGQLAANLWSKLFPALLVIMAVTGAFYPAVDLAAGEKERGTMETLLICPATRSEIVMGKFLTVILFSLSTAWLNLASMGATGQYLVSIGGSGAMSRLGDLSLPSPMAVLWLMVLSVPLAGLFSALCLALATFARSTKEGQYYLTPLLMVALGLTVFCLSPAVEITPFYSVMPIMGIALLLKALLLAPLNPGMLYWYVIPVLGTSILYSLLALWWAIEQFQREDVLFREAERFEVALWIKHVLRDKEATPNFTEAGICFVLIMLLQFGSIKFLGQTIQGDVDPTTFGTQMMKLLIIQQLVIIACPALFMGVLLTTSVVRTFRLKLPSWRMLAVAAALPFVLHPLSFELLVNLQWFFPQLPPSIAKTFSLMSDGDQPLWLVVLAFAAAPAICEEVAFRGFLLSGFRRSGRLWLAVVMSSVAFGVMHMFPQQVFNATLLGLVLGLLAIRSNSLLPPILFHFIYNSTEVVLGQLSESATGTLPDGTSQTPLSWLVTLQDEMIRYGWLTLVVCAVVAIALLRWLVNQPNADDEKTGDTL